MREMSDGNLEASLKLLGEAIECNPSAAVLFAKRAQLLVGAIIAAAQIQIFSI